MRRGGLVSGEWLHRQLDSGNAARVLDASWYLPNANRNAREEFQKRRIKGAHFFDLDKHFSDETSPYPHMLPAPQHFWRQAARLGINKNDHIVAYDGAGIFSAARCWWMFRVMGWNEERISVLDGGLPKFSEEFPQWIDQSTISDEEMESVKNAEVEKELLQSHAMRKDLLRNLEQIEENLKSQKELVLDARPAARFNGTAPEPRPGISSGHMPHSVSMPFMDVLADGRMRSPAEIEKLLNERGIDITTEGQPIICSCGSGVSAAVLDLALSSADCKRNRSLYDGSWSEYADPKILHPIIVSSS